MLYQFSGAGEQDAVAVLDEGVTQRRPEIRLAGSAVSRPNDRSSNAGRMVGCHFLMRISDAQCRDDLRLRARGCAAILIACAALGSMICIGSASVRATGVADTNSPPAGASPSEPAYPLKASANNRYLVDRNNVPFLIVGDAPQTLIARLSLDEAAEYIANRRHYGINALWVNLLCDSAEDCKRDGTTFDGIAPFAVADDLDTPNPTYFRRVDDIVNLAAANGMVVLLDPIETSGWLPVLRANGVAKAFAYGQYLGRRYKNFPNIIWMHGNDFQSWRNPVDDGLVQAVARGIRSADANHIHTAELNYLTSGTLDDPSWAPLIGLDAAYTYFPTYAQVLTEYDRRNFKPVFLVEANYEFEHLAFTDGGSAQNLRRQEYWAMLSGAAGQVYGSAYTWRLPYGWRGRLDSPGGVSRDWWDHAAILTVTSGGPTGSNR